MKPPLWFYTRSVWSGSLKPYQGADQWGRDTIVLPVIPLLLWVVIPYRTCRCNECDEIRAETELLEANRSNDAPDLP